MDKDRKGGIQLDYSILSFKELNQILMQEEEPEKELISWTISKGITAIEIYVKKLSLDYRIRLEDADREEIVNQVLDNVINYFDIKKSKNIQSYMYLSAKGKFLNYFRDNINNINKIEIDDKENKFIEKICCFEKNDISDYHEKIIMVREAYEKLNEKCKKAIYYRKIMEYSITEIMKIMDLKTMNEANLRKAISNCFKYLKELVFGKIE